MHKIVKRDRYLPLGISVVAFEGRLVVDFDVTTDRADEISQGEAWHLLCLTLS